MYEGKYVGLATLYGYGPKMIKLSGDWVRSEFGYGPIWVWSDFIC